MDPVDNLAQSLLVGLVICSAMSDGYIMVKNIFHDKKTVENAEYCKDLLKVVTSYGLDKYKKTEDGKIIVEDEKKIEPEVKEDIEIKKEKEAEKPQTPWEQRGMTKEEYEQYKIKKRQKKEREQEQKPTKKEKNKSFPMHK